MSPADRRKYRAVGKEYDKKGPAKGGRTKGAEKIAYQMLGKVAEDVYRLYGVHLKFLLGFESEDGKPQIGW